MMKIPVMMKVSGGDGDRVSEVVTMVVIVVGCVMVV